jgi:hypothetical protein
MRMEGIWWLFLAVVVVRLLVGVWSYAVAPVPPGVSVARTRFPEWDLVVRAWTGMGDAAWLLVFCGASMMLALGVERLIWWLRVVEIDPERLQQLGRQILGLVLIPAAGFLLAFVVAVMDRGYAAWSLWRSRQVWENEDWDRQVWDDEDWDRRDPKKGGPRAKGTRGQQP